jgi:hypothetical protein
MKYCCHSWSGAFMMNSAHHHWGKVLLLLLLYRFVHLMYWPPVVAC